MAATAYQKFIARHVRGARGARQTRSRFKAAVKAWRRRGSKSKARRRSRRNPVLPGVDFGPGMVYNRRKRKTKSRRRRNPLYRSAAGKYTKYHTRRRLKRQKGGGWHTNQIWAGTPNPRRRKRKSRSRRNPLFRTRSGKFSKWGGYRRLRRIPGGGWKANAILPYTAFNNPVEALTGTFEKLTEVDLWTKTILPITGGFVGTHVVSYQAFNLIAPEGTKFEGIVKHGSRVGTAVILSAATGIITRDTDMAAKVLAGGLVAFLGGVVEDVIGLAEYKKISGMDGMDDLAEDLTEELKSRIASGVREAIEGDEGSGQVSAFVTSEDLKKAPHLGDFMTDEALQRATVGSGMAARPGGGPPREGEPVQPLADLDVFSDALADGSLI